jgi:hypothetical protein
VFTPYIGYHTPTLKPKHALMWILASGGKMASAAPSRACWAPNPPSFQEAFRVGVHGVRTRAFVQHQETLGLVQPAGRKTTPQGTVNVACWEGNIRFWRRWAANSMNGACDTLLGAWSGLVCCGVIQLNVSERP